MSFHLSQISGISELTSTQHYDALAAQELSIIFKHSPTCPISLYAHREVARFCERQPNAPVYMISVRRQREIAKHVAQCTGIRHESPQIVVLRRGDVLAAASHDEITAEWIASAVFAQRNNSLA
jgi:bacillithiol system protein YtxJ